MGNQHNRHDHRRVLAMMWAGAITAAVMLAISIAAFAVGLGVDIPSISERPPGGGVNFLTTPTGDTLTTPAGDPLIHP